MRRHVLRNMISDIIIHSAVFVKVVWVQCQWYLAWSVFTKKNVTRHGTRIKKYCVYQSV